MLRSRTAVLSLLLLVPLFALPTAATAQTGAKELFMGVDGTTTQLAAKSDPGPAKPLGKPKVLGIQLTVYQLFPDGGSKAVSPATVFKAGDRIRLGFNSNRAGYLYVVNVGTSGKTSVLFPASPSESNQVRAGLVYQIPAQLGKSLKFDSTPGEEALLAVLAESPIREFEFGGRMIATANTPTTSSAQPIQLAKAEEDGAKDLMIEDDGVFQTVVYKPTSDAATQKKPLVTVLRLKHK